MNKHLVIDLGTGSYGTGQSFSPLRHLRTNWQVRQLDGVVLTHPHCDHLDDIFEFDNMNPRVLVRPQHLTEREIRAGNYQGGGPVIDKYLEINRRYSHPTSEQTDPFKPDNNGGMGIEYLVPTLCGRSNLNNHSVVTVISFANSKVIVPGDNEEASWKELLQRPHFCSSISNADVLLASHHGRKAGFCSEIFKYFQPVTTIISDGPAGETSVTDYYSRVSRGWLVHRRNSYEPYRDKKCVTTRSNGVVEVEMGWSGNKPFLKITVD